MMAGTQWSPRPCISQPPNIAAETPIAPTARFSPPVTITTIIAKPIMMLTAAVRPSAKRLNFDRNMGDIAEKMIAKITISTIRPNSLLRRNRFRGPIGRAPGARPGAAAAAPWSVSDISGNPIRSGEGRRRRDRRRRVQGQLQSR